MQDQPMNGAEPEVSEIAKQSPSARAYSEAVISITKATSLMISVECPGLRPQLGNTLCLLAGALRMRELEVFSLVELLAEQKILTKDQWLDRTAAHAERCAAMITAAIQQAQQNTPQIAVAQTLQGIKPRGNG